MKFLENLQKFIPTKGKVNRKLQKFIACIYIYSQTTPSLERI